MCKGKRWWDQRNWLIQHRISFKLYVLGLCRPKVHPAHASDVNSSIVLGGWGMEHFLHQTVGAIFTRLCDIDSSNCFTVHLTSATNLSHYFSRWFCHHFSRVRERTNTGCRGRLLFKQSNVKVWDLVKKFLILGFFCNTLNYSIMFGSIKVHERNLEETNVV